MNTTKELTLIDIVNLPNEQLEDYVAAKLESIENSDTIETEKAKYQFLYSLSEYIESKMKFITDLKENYLFTIGSNGVTRLISNFQNGNNSDVSKSAEIRDIIKTAYQMNPPTR